MQLARLVLPEALVSQDQLVALERRGSLERLEFQDLWERLVHRGQLEPAARLVQLEQPDRQALKVQWVRQVLQELLERPEQQDSRELRDSKAFQDHSGGQELLEEMA